MRTISSAHYALGICAAAIILAGCGGSTQLPNPVAPTSLGGAGTGFRVTSPNFATPERVGPNSSSAEKLTGMARLHACQIKYISNGNVIIGEEYRRDFHAQGRAKGPYTGTFIASGHWIFTYEYPLEFWALAGDFTITSGSSKVSGTITGRGSLSPPRAKGSRCKSFGPKHNLQYTSNHGSGDAKIKIIQEGDFSETLDAL